MTYTGKTTVGAGIQSEITGDEHMWANTKKLTIAGVVAAGYFALTVLLAPISFGALQFRVSEVLCILPYFFPESVTGLFVGCLLSNLLGGLGIIDVIFGSLATLLAAVMTMKIKTKWLACLPPVIVNGLVIGAVLAYTLNPGDFWRFYLIYGLQVAAGQLGVLYLLGLPLMYALPRMKFFRGLCDKGNLS
jgi:uncharacterized membrane protein